MAIARAFWTFLGVLLVVAPAGAGSPLRFNPVPPCRLIDTREAAGPSGGPALLAGQDRTFTVAGSCGVAAGARAVALNVTVTAPTGPGYLTLFPGSTTSVPLASTINYTTGQTRANNAVVPLGGAGTLSVHCGQADGSVQLIVDVTGYFVSPPIAVGSDPRGVAVTPDGTRALVTNHTNPGTVTIVDLAKAVSVGTIPVGTNPLGIAITPDGTRAVVANSEGHSLSVIDLSTNTVARTIFVPCVGTTLYDVAVTPDSTRAVLGDLSSSCTQTGLDVVTLASGALSFVGFGAYNGPFGVAVTPDGSSVLTTNGVTGSSIKRLQLSGGTLTTISGIGPSFSVAITPDGSDALVTSGPGETVKRVSLSTNSVIATIPFASNQDVHNVAITPDGSRAVVAGDFALAVLSLATNSVLTTYQLTGDSVAITPDGTTALVTDPSNGLLHAVAIP